MSFNRELFKNKILYRASYRGTKEMDKLMQGFVRSIRENVTVKTRLCSTKLTQNGV